MKINSKNLPTILWTVMAALVLISIFIYGMNLPGAPKARSVTQVTVSYPAVSEEEKTFTDSENIKAACDLMDSLKYIPFKGAKGRLEDSVTITYNLTNGSTKTVIADSKNVLWGGKLCVLKNEGEFIKLATEAFFAE